MARIEIAHDDLYRILSERIGTLEAENLSMGLLLQKATARIDELEALIDACKAPEGEWTTGG